jgi:YD repeat-containing protein
MICQSILQSDLVVKADRDANGSYETTEHIDRFTADTNGRVPEAFTYDAAGNLTYDGVYQYAYDAWNRMVSVTKAYRDYDGTGAVDAASIATGSQVRKKKVSG